MSVTKHANSVRIVRSAVLFGLHFRTDCCFSPDDKLLLTGTSVKKEEGNGKLVFFDRTSFQRVYEVEVTNAVSSASRSPQTPPCLLQNNFFFPNQLI